MYWYFQIYHLEENQKYELKDSIQEFKHLFPDVPNQTKVIYHDVDGDSEPIKKHPYRLNPIKSEHMKEGINHMLENGIIEPSYSDWSSPCMLVSKSDKSYRFRTDYK